MYKIIIATGLSTVLMLSACSKKAEYASDASAEAVEATDVSAKVVDTVQNPQEIVSAQQSALEQNRQLVKSAQIAFTVKDIQKTTSTLENQLQSYQGYVEVKQVNYVVEGAEFRNKLDGTSDVFEKVIPTVQLVVRIPNQNVTAFLNGLIPLMQNFEHQYYEAKRYQLKLLEAQLQMAMNTSESPSAIANQLQRLTTAEAQDRLQFSTIELNYTQAAQLRQTQDINIRRVAELHNDPFLARMWQSIKLGGVGIREAILWLVMIWPVYALMAVIYVLFRVYRARRKAK